MSQTEQFGFERPNPTLGGFQQFTDHDGRAVWVRRSAVVLIRVHECNRGSEHVDGAAELVLGGVAGQAVVVLTDATTAVDRLERGDV